jgi:hypothetical protein
MVLVQQVGPVTAYLGKAEAVLDTTHPWVTDVRDKRGELLTKVTSPKHRADPSFQRTLGQVLAQLKSTYQDAYVDAHNKTRLGANDDKKKGALTKDTRLGQIQKLAGVEMMPTQQLRAFENGLFALKTCFSLTKVDLDADPICPHCAFRPLEETAGGAPVAAVLRNLDEQLDELVRDWTATLIANLEDPTVAENVELLTDPKGKKAVGQFLEGRELPDPVDAVFVKALQEVLSGLQKVVLSRESLHHALISGGLPCTVGEAKERFESHLSEATKGKDPSKVRIVIE